MLSRIEVAVRPPFADPEALSLLRKATLANPDLVEKIRWLRVLDVFWLDLDISREEIVQGIHALFYDPVMSWVFSGNLAPSLSGSKGTLEDLAEFSPHRPGNFWGVEKKFRPGVTDHVSKSVLDGFRILLRKDLETSIAASGKLLLLEGKDLQERDLASLSRSVFSNELIESWSIYQEQEVLKNHRFHSERVGFEIPKVISGRFSRRTKVQKFPLSSLAADALLEMSKHHLWALNQKEMMEIQKHFSKDEVIESRKTKNLSDPTDVELEILAQTWSEHCKHKIFAAKYSYVDHSSEKKNIPSEGESLYRSTIQSTTQSIPRPWLLSVFTDNAGIIAFDEDDAICLKVETHNSPSALDPYGGALTGIVGVNRDILGCGLGAKPIFNTNVFCVAPPDYSKDLPERLMHPRRILDGIRMGVEHGGNKSGIPTVNGALCFDERYLGKPLVYCGTGGILPRKIRDTLTHEKKITPGDRIYMIGGRIGKDGIHGATFSSLALDESSPMSAVQLGDPITQKRMTDFIIEARDRGFYRCITDNGAGGLSSSVGEMAQITKGAKIDLSKAKTKYPGLLPYELVISESQERMTVAVPPDSQKSFEDLAKRRGVEVSDLGEFTQSGFFEVYDGEECVAYVDLNFLHKGTPKLELKGEWNGKTNYDSWKHETLRERIDLYAPSFLLKLLSRPNIASKEWLIRQYDHEVQGSSVLKPLQTVKQGKYSSSSPNDSSVLKPKPGSYRGVVIGCGIQPKYSDVDPYLMAQASVDEAVRNVLCAGAEYGQIDHILALTDNFCWPDPVDDPKQMAALIRACYGMREAALQLETPFISGKDSMKNDYRGKLHGVDVKISVPPTLLITAIGTISDIRYTRSSEFKEPGDAIYLLHAGEAGLFGSEAHQMVKEEAENQNEKIIRIPFSTQHFKVPKPDFPRAKTLYSWFGGTLGRMQTRLKSVHDLSEGGLLVALSECLFARNLGAKVKLPQDQNFWEFAFGERFHSFLVTVPPGSKAQFEKEWEELKISYLDLGAVQSNSRLEVEAFDGVSSKAIPFSISGSDLKQSWNKQGYWE